MKQKTKILVVRIKKRFRKYRSFWYNGCAGTTFFVKPFNKEELIVLDFECGTQSGAGMSSFYRTDYFLLKKHVDVIGKILTKEN